jgi:hypothetical protein
MIYRIACLLFISYGLAVAQESPCSGMAAKVHVQARSSTPVWKIYAENRDSGSVRLRVSDSGFQWKIEEPGKQRSNVIMSGGLGPGRASTGSTPKSSGSVHILAPGRNLLAARFDLQHETEARNELLENHEYRITFEFEVAVFGNGGQSVACRLATDAQRFRFTRAAKHSTHQTFRRFDAQEYRDSFLSLRTVSLAIHAP